MATKPAAAPGIPKTPGEAIDQMYTIREQRLALARQVQDLQTQEGVLEELTASMLKAQGLDSGKGKLATFTISPETYEPNVVDWEKFYAYVARTKAWMLLQKRVGSTAIKERWADNKEIPGVERRPVQKYSLTKR